MVRSADFLFSEAKIIIELKVLETEFGLQPQILMKVAELAERYPGVHPDDPRHPLREELLKLLEKPLRKRVAKANQQIKQTKIELGLLEYSGMIVMINDGFRGIPPGYVMGLLGRIMSRANFSTTKCVLYMTNHFIEVPDNPYACLLWSPQYADDADQVLVDFVNDLGRKWRAYMQEIMGVFEYNEEQEWMDVMSLSVVTGTHRNQRYQEPFTEASVVNKRSGRTETT